jgi:hypothetical protein
VYDIAAVTSLHQSHHLKFIRQVVTVPELMIFIGIEQAFAIANRCFSHSKNSNGVPQLIAYDTTFKLGGYYMSTLGAVNPELKEHPFFPICYLIHDRKFSEIHESFLNWAFGKLSMNPNIPVITDREDAICNFFELRSDLKDQHLICFRHVCSMWKYF